MVQVKQKTCTTDSWSTQTIAIFLLSSDMMMIIQIYYFDINEREIGWLTNISPHILERHTVI